MTLNMPNTATGPASFVDGHRAGAIVTVRPSAQVMSRQGLPNFDGVSAKTAGTRGLCMQMVVFPPGAAAKAHYHDGFETAIYIIEGRVETLYGDELQHVVVNVPGDFVFIPASVPHRPRNLSETAIARAIVCRNDPREQESVALCDEPSG